MYRHLQGNPNSSGLQCKVVYWPALAVGCVAQLAAAHCLNEQTLDPQSAARQTHLCPSQPHYGIHPTGNDSLHLIVLPVTNCCSFNYLRGMEGWVGLSNRSVNNLLKIITRQRSWCESNPRPLSHWSETVPLRHRAILYCICHISVIGQKYLGSRMEK